MTVRARPRGILRAGVALVLAGGLAGCQTTGAGPRVQSPAPAPSQAEQIAAATEARARETEADRVPAGPGAPVSAPKEEPAPAAAPARDPRDRSIRADGFRTASGAPVAFRVIAPGDPDGEPDAAAPDAPTPEAARGARGDAPAPRATGTARSETVKTSTVRVATPGARDPDEAEAETPEEDTEKAERPGTAEALAAARPRARAVVTEALPLDRGARFGGPGLSDLERGLALLRAGEPERAHDAFMRALRTGRRPAAALTGAGLAAEARGLLAAAESYFAMARDLAPDSHVVHNNLGVIRYRRGDYGGAHRAFRTAYALSSGTNAAAEENMLRARAALDARMPATDPRVTHRVEDHGDGAYRLVALPEPAPGRYPGTDPAATPAP